MDHSLVTPPFGPDKVRVRYWAKPFALTLRLLAVLIIPGLIFYAFGDVAQQFRSGSGLAILFFLGALGFTFFAVLNYLRHLYEAVRLSNRRFEGLATFSGQVSPGETLRFSYADRLAYREPAAPVTVFLDYVEYAILEDTDPQRRRTIYTHSVPTTAYELSTGLDLAIPASGGQLDLSRNYPSRLRRQWNVVVTDRAAFRQRFTAPVHAASPGVRKRGDED